MVCSPRSSITAISLLVLPSATSRSTCNSRGESDSSGLRSRLSRSPRWMRASSRSETCGLRYEPQRATVRKASSNSAEEAFFRTKARAPLRMAPTTEFSSSYIERITTFTPGQWRSSSVVASMPFIPGRPISMRTICGAVFLHKCTASVPLSASPTTRNSVPRSRIVLTPSRTNLWSSTRTMSNGIIHPSGGPQGRNPHGRSHLTVAGDGKVQPRLRGIMLHAQQSQPPASTKQVRSVEPLSIITNLQSNSRTCGLYRNFDDRATGMLDGVLDRLLGDLVHSGGDLGIDPQGRIDIHVH